MHDIRGLPSIRNPWVPKSLNLFLCRFKHASWTQATGTYFHIPDSAILYGAHSLQVWIPSSFWFVVGVADIVARLRALTTYLANLGHWFLPPIKATSLESVFAFYFPPQRTGRLPSFPAIELSNTSSLIWQGKKQILTLDWHTWHAVVNSKQ